MSAHELHACALLGTYWQYSSASIESSIWEL